MALLELFDVGPDDDDAVLAARFIRRWAVVLMAGLALAEAALAPAGGASAPRQVRERGLTTVHAWPWPPRWPAPRAWASSRSSCLTQSRAA